MPQLTKQSQRQIATPSPTPGDILNTLLVVKDAVNSTLLNEHNRFADLSNALSEVETQIRYAFENTIKALKTEIEKRKRRIVPGIKKLQDILQSLSKSETKCKASEKGYKNAVAKKAKRRIKDTQKYLKEFISSDTELSLSIFVSDQITTLCQRLMHIPPTIVFFKTQVEVSETVRNDESESDSESSRSGSRNNTPIDHIYNEIETCETTKTYQRTKHDFLSDRRDDRQTRRTKSKKYHATTTSNRLNSVMLFSSDSESGEDDQQPKRHSTSADGGHSHSPSISKHKLNQASNGHATAPDYEQLIQPALEDVFRNFTTISHTNGKQHDQSRTKSPVVHDNYEIPIQTQTEKLFAPKALNFKCVTPSQGGSSKYTATTHTPSKRILPAIPKTASQENCVKKKQLATHDKSEYTERANEDCTDSSHNAINTSFDNFAMANNTVELLADAQNLLNDIQATNEEQEMDSNPSAEADIVIPAINTLPQDKVENTTLIEPDYVDIEEVKFRESVRTARREILDRLKNRCSNNDKLEPYIEADARLNSNVNKNESTTHQKYLKHSQDELLQNSSLKMERIPPRFTHDAGSLPSRQETGRSESQDHQSKEGAIKGLYKSRLVHTYESESPTPSFEYRQTENVSDDNGKHSMVSAAIRKFECASHTSKTIHQTGRKPRSVAKNGHTTKFRSTSEPPPSSSQIPHFSVRSTRRGKQNNEVEQPKRENRTKALRPRTESTETDGNVFDDTSIYLSKSSTENDLLKLIANESSSSIRKQWIRRRSLSMTPKMSVTEIKCRRMGPEYETFTSIVLPDHSARCYISSIVVIQNDSLVLLDETHSYLHLYDNHYKHKDSYRLLDTPKGCVKVNESTVAVSFPYKKCICTYSITMGAILSDREINVPCSTWIVDIAYCEKVLYVLCKDGNVHVLSADGTESNKVCLGMSGQLFIPNSGNRLFIMGENKISKFNADGVLLTSKSGVDAHSMIVIENKIYIADRLCHRIVPLVNNADVSNLTSNKLMYPLAMCCSINGKYLFLSQFEESMDVTLTRTIQVLKRKHV